MRARIRHHHPVATLLALLLAVGVVGAERGATPLSAAEAAALAGPFGFEADAEGWTVQAGGPDRPTGATSWTRQGPGGGSPVAFAVAPYANAVSTTLDSPPLPSGGGPVVVEWWERYELEPGGDFDHLTVSWSTDTAAGTVLREGVGGTSPRWPDWNRVRVTLDPGAPSFRLHFAFTSDELGCSSEGPCTIVPQGPGDGTFLGAWIDDVTVWPADAVDHRQPDPLVEGTFDAAGPVWPDPADVPQGTTVMDKGGFVLGVRELERRYPDLIGHTTVREALGDPNAVSMGDDGLPPWDQADTGDGRDLHVVTLTDESIPDRDKGHVVLSVAHGGEYCGIEATPRAFEALARAFVEAPETVIDAGTRDGRPVTMTVAELLARTKVHFVEISPDGWMWSQTNGAGDNTNRIAYGTGWTVPFDEVINDEGWSTLTTPEGGAVTTYLTRIRETELGGRPFAAALDMHGPVPSGMLLLHPSEGDVGAPARVVDVAERMTERTYEVLTGSDSPAVRQALLAAHDQASDVRHIAERTVGAHAGEAETDKILYAEVDWNRYGTAWEILDYRPANSWGGFFGAASGLGADAFTHELPCNVYAGVQDHPRMRQLYYDNLRAILDVVLVHGATRFEATADDLDLGGPVGYVPNPLRISDADGNPSPPSAGRPGTPFHAQLPQLPYDVASSDWFAEAAGLAVDPIVAVDPGAADPDAADLSGLATVAVADHTSVDVDALRAFARAGGNVVLTDAALQLVPEIFDDDVAVREHRGYVGYADLQEHPWTRDLYGDARQTYHPTPLGHPLLLERDQYWISCTACLDGSRPDTITENSAPLWTVVRSGWEALGGTTIGTVDPPAGPHATHDGADTTETILGTAPLGDGRVVIFGGVLPQPTEQHHHPFGLAAHALTPTGHHLLLQALSWNAADERPAP